MQVSPQGGRVLARLCQPNLHGVSTDADRRLALTEPLARVYGGQSVRFQNDANSCIFVVDYEEEIQARLIEKCAW